VVVKPLTCSVKVKATVAVSPTCRTVSEMVIDDARAGAVLSMVIVKPALAGLTLPATSTALAVTVWAPPDSMALVIDHVPAPLAVALPSTVVPSVS